MSVRFPIPLALAALLVLSTTILLLGCGGGLRLSPTPTPNPGNAGATPPGPSEAARFTVDVTTGKVTVAQTTRTAGALSPQAVYLNPAVSFTTTDLLTQTGDLGRRKIVATLTNNSKEAIGRTGSNPRVVFSNIVNVPPFMDLRPYTQVGTWSRWSNTGDQWNAVAGPDASNNFYVVNAGSILRVNGSTQTVIAGEVWSEEEASFADGVGTAARFFMPRGLCLVGNVLYIADTYNHRIRRMDLASGQVVTIAGTGVEGQGDGTGAVATFSEPSSIAGAYGGILYVSDQGSGLIRRITQTGSPATAATSYSVSTIAGGGAGPGSVREARFTPVPARSAWYNQPQDLAVANDFRYVYIGARDGIHLLNVSNMTDVCLITNLYGYRDGAARDAQTSSYVHVAPLSDRALAFTDYSNACVRLLYCTGTANSSRVDDWAVTTLAGAPGRYGSSGGTGVTASFSNLKDTVASGGNAVWALEGQGSNSLRRVAIGNDYMVLLTGQPSGTGTQPDSVRFANADGVTPSPGGEPRSYITCPTTGSLLPGQSVNMDWWFVVPSGVKAFSFGVSVEAPSEGLAPLEGASGSGVGSLRVAVRTFAGSTTGVAGDRNGGLAESTFNRIHGLTTDTTGNVFAAQANSIRPIYVGGGYSTAWTLDGQWLGWWGIAAAPQTENCTFYIRAASSVRGSGQYQIMVATASGGYVTPGAIAGSDYGANTADGRGDAACFVYPWALAVDSRAATVWVLDWQYNTLYDRYRNVLREVRYLGGGLAMADADRTHWQVTTYPLPQAYSTKRIPSVDFACVVLGPSRTGMAVAPDGSIYCCSGQWEQVLRLRPQAPGQEVQVETVAGGFQNAGYRDGTGTAALFNSPTDLALDSSGYMYVTDCGNNRVRRVSPTGVVTTVAGTGVPGLADGTGDTAMLDRPFCCALDSRGDLYVADGQYTERIRRLSRIISTP